MNEDETIQQATRLSLSAQAAVGGGDIREAADKHRQAGELLRRLMDGPPTRLGKAFIALLAATQYFKAGDYATSLEIASPLTKEDLPGYESSLAKLVRAATRRRRPGYARKVRERAAQLRKENNHEKLLIHLTEHAMVFDRVELAGLRSECCAGLGDPKSSAWFSVLAEKWRKEDEIGGNKC